MNWNLLIIEKKWMLLSAMLSGVLLIQIPLFNQVGYESSAFISGFLGLCSWIETCFLLRNKIAYGPRGKDPVVSFLKCWMSNCVFILLPFGFLLLNLLRVPLCDIKQGLGFWALLPTTSIFFGVSLAWFGSSINVKNPFRAGIVLILLELIWVLWRLAWEPPIQAYEWWIGWVAGSIYDEAISIPTALIWSRVALLALSISMVAFAQFWLDRKRGLFSKWSLVLTITGFLVWGGVLKSNPNIHHDRESVRKQLGGERSSEHFKVYYKSGSLTKQQQDVFLKDAEFRYAQLEEFFKEDPVFWRGRKVEIFLYPDPETQNKLMGARHTMVARPWTHQMHIRWRGEGDSILTHELAHLFTAPFADHWLDLPIRYGVFLDLGLLEGIAAAAEWPISELDLHETAAALRRIDKAPDLNKVLSGAGFWAQPSGKAYRMTGSFMRWLIEQHGIDPLKKMYSGGDYQKVYGQSIGDLISAWEEFIDELELSDEQLVLARARYDRPSIFDKVCPRAMAELRRKREALEGERDWSAALRMLSLERKMAPKNINLRFTEVGLLIKLKEYEQASDFLMNISKDKLSEAQRAALLDYRGNIFWVLGDRESAEQRYDSLLSLGLSDSRRRAVSIKRFSAAEQVRHYLVDQVQGGAAWITLFDLEREDQSLAHYLMGVRLFYEGYYEQAKEYLATPQSIPELEEERFILRLKSSRLSGDWGSWKEAMESPPPLKQRVKALLEEEQKRASWTQAVQDFH